MSWEVVEMRSFLSERKGRFKPNDKAIKGLKRIEKIDFSGNIYLSDKASKTDMILIKQGDLVISGINVEKGAMSIYKGEEDVVATIHYSSYEYNLEKIDLDFLRHFLKSSEFLEALKEQVPGGIKTEIKPKHILPLKVCIPTNVYEQRKVVDFLDNQNNIIEKQSTELTQQLVLVKQLRQAFLREAMQGKLVPQDPNDLPANPQNKFFIYVLECSDGSWYKGFTTDIIKRWKEHVSGKGAEHTKKYPPVKLIHWEEYETQQEAVSREKYLKSGHGRDWLKQKEKLGQLRQAGEPASVLLEKIKAEKEHLVKEKKIKKQKPLPPITEEEIPFEIPENWVWCRLGKIALYSEGGKSLKGLNTPCEENGWGVIKTSAITSGEFLELENKSFTNTTNQYQSIKINEGDLLFCRASGSKGLAGKSCVVRNSPYSNLILSDKSIRYILSKMVGVEYVNCYNSSEFGIHYYLSLGTKKSTTMNNITRPQFDNLPIPLPPLSEQQRIVAKLDELMQYCDKLEASIKASQQQNELLLQQVLRQALEPKVKEVGI